MMGKTALRHPFMMAEEAGRFVLNAAGYCNPLLAEGDIFFETHSHSERSNSEKGQAGNPGLAGIVHHLLDSMQTRVMLWSLTDYNTTDGFDDLASGKYRLEKHGVPIDDLQVHSDGRSLAIYATRNGNRKEIVLFRAAEKFVEGNAEIGIHGYAGQINPARRPVKDTIMDVHDHGAFCVVVHPYFWTGLGFSNERAISDAVAAGAIGIEMNATELYLYGKVRAELDVRQLEDKYPVRLVAGGDCHRLPMYGRTGVVFSEHEYAMRRFSRDTAASTIPSETSQYWPANNPVDVARKLIESRMYRNRFTYCTPRMFFDFFRFLSAGEDRVVGKGMG